MIFFTEQLIKDKQELINSLQKEINLNNIFIHYQRFKENLLSNTIKVVAINGITIVLYVKKKCL